MVLGVLSVCAGALTGFVCALFRMALVHADDARGALIAWAHPLGPMGCALLIGVCAAGAGAAALLVRRVAPYAGGSGIPHVEAVLTGALAPASIVLIPVKFIGGVLSMGAGLALGREGPCVQMGASIAHFLGRVMHHDPEDCRVLLGAGAGAGLATAFNAPLAGSIFVLEELVRRFDTRTTIATLGASGGAIVVARAMLGDAIDLDIGPIPAVSHGTLWAFLVVGIAAGIAGVAYNRAIIGVLRVAEGMERIPVEVRAACIGAAVGAIAWFVPRVVGGGDSITASFLASVPGAGIVMATLLVRFVLGPVSYGASTPGGLFAPMLTIGALIGVIFGQVVGVFAPSLAPDARAFGMVGMAAFFAAVVRAPVTGIVLVTEMTGGFLMVVPMILACFPAMIIPTVLRDAPIYTALYERLVRTKPEDRP